MRKEIIEKWAYELATQVREVRGSTVYAHEWTAADFGLAACKMEELRVDGPEASAAVIRAVFSSVTESAEPTRRRAAVRRPVSCRSRAASRHAWRACRRASPSTSFRASCCSTSWVTCQP